MPKIISNKTYVEQRDGGYFITDSHTPLDSIVYAFQRGEAAESIKRSLPVLSLEQVYGAITFYLSHQQEIDTYLAQAEAELDEQSKELNVQARAAKPALFGRLIKARKAF